MSVDLGQHFLTDPEVLGDIVAAADLTRDDVVLEIGPGKGVLTEALAKRAKQVIAVELDRTLVAELQKKFKGVKNVEIIHEDILRWWGGGAYAAKEESRQGNCFMDRGFKVVANIPYRITAPILRMFLEREPRPSSMVLMVQKEVAKRVCAEPGQMSVLSVSVQYYAKPEIVRIVPRTAFDPAPKVDSAVLRIQPHPRPLLKGEGVWCSFSENPHLLPLAKGEREGVGVRSEDFFRLVKLGFSSRRKQLQNALASGLHITNDDAKKALHAVGLDARVRAQELSIEAWMGLTPHLFNDKRSALSDD